MNTRINEPAAPGPLGPRSRPASGVQRCFMPCELQVRAGSPGPARLREPPRPERAGASPGGAGRGQRQYSFARRVSRGGLQAERGGASVGGP